MKIDLDDASARTIRMLANFLHRDRSEIDLDQDLRKHWKMTPRDFDVLEIWIEGPISRSMRGYFQDVEADVSFEDLRNPKLKTVDNLVDLIWKRIPKGNKK